MDDLAKRIAALKRAGASEAEIDAYMAEHDTPVQSPGARFADPNYPAKTTDGEEIRGGAPRKQGVDEWIAGTIGAGVQGATMGFSDELGGMAGALTNAVAGKSPSLGYTEHRDAARKQLHAFEGTNPTASAVSELIGGIATPVGAVKGVGPAVGMVPKMFKGAATGAAVGGAYGLGTGEGSTAQQMEQMATGAKAGAGLGVIAPTLPKLGRLLGITTSGGRDQAALQAIETAITRSGQKVDDVLARAETMVAEGKAPNLADVMGPAARNALDAMASLGDEAAGQAAQMATTLGKGEMAGAFGRAARRQPPRIGAPMSKVGLVSRVATAGLQRSGRKESEAALRQMLEPAENFLGKAKSGRVVGTIPQAPDLERQALEEALVGGNPNLAVSAWPSEHSEQWLARRNKLQGISVPEGAKPGYGAKAVAGEPDESELRALAEYLIANQDDNLETLLQLSVQGGKKSPDMAFLKKTLGMSGVLAGALGLQRQR